MARYTGCRRCTVKIGLGKVYCDKCQYIVDKWRQNRDEERERVRYARNKASGVVKENKYGGTKWRKLRAHILDKYNGMCVYTYYEMNLKVVTEDRMVVHHIEEATDDNFYDENNLILITHAVHELIHDIYDNGTKEEVSELKSKLKSYAKRFCDEFKTF